MATFQPYPTASNAYQHAVDLDAMRADLPKLRALIGKMGPNPNAPWNYKASVMNCAVCAQPFQQGEYITRKWHTRNKAGSPTFPGWQHKHITCPRDGNPYTLPNTPPAPVTEMATDAELEQAATQTSVTQTTPVDVSDDMLAGIIKAVVDAINPILASASNQTQQAVGILTDALSKQQTAITALHAELNTLREQVQNAAPTNLHVTLTALNNEVVVTALPPIRHKAFDRVISRLCALRPGSRNIWLAGPAGTGKTTAAKQIAAALTYTTGPKKGQPLDFGFTGAIDTEYKLNGYTDANGNIIHTAFRRIWTHGGVFLFDECDASQMAALLAFNAPLANSMAVFPAGHGEQPEIVERHPDCYILSGANTLGYGGDGVYVGAMKMNGAFLDRFLRLAWDYDERMERMLIANDEWYAVLADVRAQCAAVKSQFLITLRMGLNGADLLAAGISRAEVIDDIFGFIQRQQPETWERVGVKARAYAASV